MAKQKRKPRNDRKSGARSPTAKTSGAPATPRAPKPKPTAARAGGAGPRRAAGRFSFALARAPLARELRVTGPVAASDDPKSDVLENLRRSVAGLREEHSILDAVAHAQPAPSRSDRQNLLQMRGQVFGEKTAHEALLLELEAADVVIDPPTANSGRDLADALATLEEMRRTTDQISRLLNLSAQAIGSFQNHRTEVQTRRRA
jgi:hypothetical protein